MLWHFLTQNGIGQNISAGFLLGIPTAAVGIYHWRRNQQLIHTKLDSIHAKLDAAKPKARK